MVLLGSFDHILSVATTTTLVSVTYCVWLETHATGVHHTIVVVTGVCTHLVRVESTLVGLARARPLGHSLSRRSWLEALVGCVHATISLRRGHHEVVGRLLGLEERRGSTTCVV